MSENQENKPEQDPQTTEAEAGSVPQPVPQQEHSAEEAGREELQHSTVSLLEQARQLATGQQSEMPFAFVAGEAVTDLPRDLYIPPDALEVFLEAFEGPLDLLLYRIKRQNIDILDIDVAEITSRYVAYVDLMEASQFDLAA